MFRHRSLRLRRSLRVSAATLCLATGASATAATVSLVGAAPAGASAKLPSCNLKALSSHKGVVDITFWNSMVQANGQTLASITNAFNSSQSKVHVTLVNQASYDDTWNKYTAGLSNGQLPDAVQLEDVRTQEAIDTNSFLPVQSCINAAHYSTSDYLARPLDYWKVNGVQWALPFAVSVPIVYYNQLSFTKAGLNPNTPPATLLQMVEDAKALKASGTGMGLVLDPWHLETWLATANQPFVNNNNGRSGRATKGVFDTKTAQQIFTDLDLLVKSGDAVTNPSSGPSEFDNLLGIGTGKCGMTIDSSADLGTVEQLLGKGQYPNVKLGVGPFPALSSSIKGGVEPGGSAVYISSKVPALDQAAAWDYLTYLSTTQSMATWAAGTGYIPLRKSSINTSTIQKLWSTQPAFKVAYEEMVNGANTTATSGSVIGPYDDVRTDVLNAEIAMYTTSISPAKTLANALSQVNATISGYNSRLG
ncbi:MAG TPA: ABC transporter substrate-binding protein [Acidimicrobiales bacterium]|jgi:sn-glycerol 3-phosphate transport system substrate-binding protein